MIRTHKRKKIPEIAVSIIIKMLKNGKEVCSIHSGTPSRFISRIQSKSFDVCLIKASYGKHINNFGELVEFTNEGEYKNKKDALNAFEAFIEG